MAKKPIDPKVLAQVGDELERYVYALVDPRDMHPFYIGKGRGTRFAAHGVEAMLSADTTDTTDTGGDESKVDKIRAIRKSGKEPAIWIIRYGMKTDTEYTSVEAACIDLMHSVRLAKCSGSSDENKNIGPNQYPKQLTNQRKEQNKRHGIMLLDDLIDEMAAKPLTTDIPLLTINLGEWKELPEDVPGGRRRKGCGYKPEWLSSDERRKHYEEICLSACAWWTFAFNRAGKYEYAVVVHRGVTRALMQIKPGTMEEKMVNGKKRRGFQFEVIESGDKFDEIVGKHGYRIKLSQTQWYWPQSRKN